MNYEDKEFDYRKPMPKKEKRLRKLLHRIHVLKKTKRKENKYAVYI